MFYAFREPNLFAFRVIFSHLASIFPFSVDILFTFSYLFTHIDIFTFEGATHDSSIALRNDNDTYGGLTNRIPYVNDVSMNLRFVLSVTYSYFNT